MSCHCAGRLLPGSPIGSPFSYRFSEFSIAISRVYNGAGQKWPYANLSILEVCVCALCLLLFFCEMLGWDFEKHKAAWCSGYILVKAREELTPIGLEFGTLLLIGLLPEDFPFIDLKTLFFPSSTSCPCTDLYNGQSMPSAHAMLGITGCAKEWEIAFLSCPTSSLAILTKGGQCF